jgi:hypothetical protein
MKAKLVDSVPSRFRRGRPDSLCGDHPARQLYFTPTKGLVDLNNYVVNLSNGTTTGFMNVANASSINKQGNIAGLGSYFNRTKTIQARFLLKRID